MHLSTNQWLLGALIGLMIGFSKTGVPGVGILVVPLMAQIFHGSLSVGTMALLLVFADMFAVGWYRRHARWDKLRELIPVTATGLILGGIFLWWLGGRNDLKHLVNPLIGLLVLAMLAVHFLRQKYWPELSLTSRSAVVGTGLLAGFSTAVSNAAGPIMSIYLTGIGLAKDEFMGTGAWYYFLLNLSKIPLYALLMHLHPDQLFLSAASLRFDIIVCPMVVLGVFTGKKALPLMKQTHFDTIVLLLAGVAAIKLFFP